MARDVTAARDAAKGAARVAVLDCGKTNLKLSACTPGGAVIETLSIPNRVLPGPPWRHHDLPGQTGWLAGALRDLCARHPLERITFAGHGVGGVVTGSDPDTGDGTAVPMIDYEQEPPGGLNAAYVPQSGGFLDRGSAVMAATTHTARQVLWAETHAPEAFATARWILGIPQYWAWRLSGVAASEVTHLAAQSHLWNTAERRWSPIVAARGWTRLMPPFRHAADDLGPIRPAFAARHGLPPLRVHTGLHDSSANFHRYRAGAEASFVLVSTGTWVVGLADGIDPARRSEARGMTLNADVGGAPVAGALVMGGREYAAVAGSQPEGATADPAVVAALVARGTMALPAFGGGDGQFPGSGGRGRIAGPPPADASERLALAVLYVALLTLACADALDARRPLVLDGSFVRDPVYSALVAAIRAPAAVLTGGDGDGVAAGAATLAAGTSPAAKTHPVTPLGIPGIVVYARRWMAAAEGSAR